jgi:hypothetical protein
MGEVPKTYGEGQTSERPGRSTEDKARKLALVHRIDQDYTPVTVCLQE